MYATNFAYLDSRSTRPALCSATIILTVSSAMLVVGRLPCGSLVHLRAERPGTAERPRNPDPNPDPAPKSKPGRPQDEALRPFVTVLRTCDAPTVREAAVRCVVHAIAAHPRGLGSGWRSVLEALQVALPSRNSEPSPSP